MLQIFSKIRKNLNTKDILLEMNNISIKLLVNTINNFIIIYSNINDHKNIQLFIHK